MYIYIYKYVIIYMYIYIYISIYFSCQSKPDRPDRFAPPAEARAAMAPASSAQISEMKMKWQHLEGSAELSEHSSQPDASSQSPEDEVEVQEKTEDLFWRTH